MDRVTRSPTCHAAGWAAVGGDWCGLEAAGTGKVGMAGGCRSQCRLDCTCRPGERAARLYGESGDLTGQNWPGSAAATVGGGPSLVGRAVLPGEAGLDHRAQTNAHPEAETLAQSSQQSRELVLS